MRIVIELNTETPSADIPFIAAEIQTILDNETTMIWTESIRIEDNTTIYKVCEIYNCRYMQLQNADGLSDWIKHTTTH